MSAENCGSASSWSTTAPSSPLGPAVTPLTVVPITIDNSQSSPTGTYEQLLNIDSARYSSYINANWTNVRFQYASNGTNVGAWIEGNATNTAQNTLVWLHLFSIPQSSTVTVNMLIDPTTAFDLSLSGPIGEAPQLSAKYGQFDDGSSVFPFYDNFSGTSLDSKWHGVIAGHDGGSGQGTLTVNDGATFTTPNQDTYVFLAAAAKIDFPAAVTEMLYQSTGSPTTGVEPTVGETKAYTTSDWIDLCNGWEADWIVGQSPPESYLVYTTSRISTADKTGWVVPPSDTVVGINWISQSSVMVLENYSVVKTSTTSGPTIGAYYPYIGLSNSRTQSGSGSFSAQWVRARALSQSGGTPTTSYGAPEYTVTFSETGMPVAAGGGVSFNGGALTAFQSGGTLSFGGLVNGSYTYTISAGTGYKLVSSTPGSPVTVSGANVPVTVTFEAVYSVTFTETGMPPSAGGGVAFDGGSTTPFGGGGVVTFTEPNATYPYVVTAGTGYKLVSSTPGSPVAVSGANVPVTVTFQAVYSVTFTETGMPPSAGGGVAFDGGSTTPFGVGGTVTFTEPNGTYPYVVTAGTGYKLVSSTPGSPVAVSGTNVPVTVTFAVQPTLTFGPAGNDIGGTVTLTGSGFSSGYTVTPILGGMDYACYPSAVTVGPNGAFTCAVIVPSVTPGSYSIQASTTADGTISASGSFTVYADPTVSSVSPTGPLNYDEGQTAATLGVTLTYSGPNTATVNWFASTSLSTCTPTGSSLHAGTSFTPSTSSTGTTYYCAVVSDSGVPSYTYASSNAVEVTVSTALVVSTPTPGSQTVDQGQTASMSGSAPTTGTSPYAYQWLEKAPGAGSYTNAVNCVAATTLTCSFVTTGSTATGVYSFELQVTDSATTPSVVPSSPVTVTVSTALVVSTPTPGSQTVDQGQTASMSGSAPTTGTSPYAYQWLEKAPGAGSYTNAVNCVAATTLTCSFVTTGSTATGVYSFELQVTDSATTARVVPSSPVTVTVNTALTTASAPTIVTSLIDQGQTLTAASGTLPNPLYGSGTVTYTWLASATSGGTYTAAMAAAICATASGTATAGGTVNCVALSGAAVGTYYFEIQLKDSATSPTTTISSPSSSSATVNTVLGAPGTPTVTTPVDLGQTTTVSASTASGGSGPITYHLLYSTSSGGTYTAVPGSSCAVTGSAVNCAFTLLVTGTFYYRLTATDTASTPVTTTSPASLGGVVNSALTTASAPTIVTSLIDQGQTLTAASDTLPNPLYGSGTVTYTWLASATSGGTYTAAMAAAICATASGTATDGGTVNCVALSGAAVGTYYFEIQLKDSATSPTTTISSPSSSSTTLSSALTIASAPTIVTSLIDQGQTLTAASGTLPNPLYGSGTVTYTWLASATSGGTYTALTAAAICATVSGTATDGGTVNCVALSGATVGTYYFEIQLTDSATSPTTTTSAPSSSSTTVVKPAITLTPNQGPSGTSVTISGIGFTPGATITTTIGTGGSITTCGAIVAPGRSFSCAVTITSATPAGYPVTATGADNSFDLATATFTVTSPAITLAPDQDPSGISVTVVGTGFTPTTDTGGAITVTTTIGTGASITSCGATVTQLGGSAGSFSCTVTITSPTPADYPVTATGSDGSFDQATAAFTVTTRSLTPSPTQGPSGVAVTASGAGFTPGVTITISISLGGSIGSVSACTASGTGTYSGCTFTVSGAAGTYTITATGADGGNDHAAVEFAVTSPAIGLTPNQGPSGISVTVSGTGFTPGATITTTIGAGGSITRCGVAVSSFGGSVGSFSCVVTIALTTGSAGAYTVTASGSDIGAVPTDQATVTFEVTSPAITLTPNQGSSGSLVTVEGTGFAPTTDTGGAITVSVGIGTGASISSCGATVAPSGGFIGSFNCVVTISLTTGPPSVYTVTATGSDGSLDQAAATFVVTTLSLTLSPGRGPSGVTVTVTVSGFASTDTSIAVRGPTSMTVCTVTVSPVGSGGGSCMFTANAASGFTFSSGGTPNSLTATGNSASDGQTAIFTGTSLTLTLSPAQGPSGVMVTATVAGFASTDTSIAVKGPGATSLCTIEVSGGSGGGSCTFTASAANGFAFGSGGTPNPVTATGNAAADGQTATFTGTTTSVTLSPTSGPSGVTVTTTVSGFASTDTSIAVKGPGATSLCTIEVSGGSGAGSCMFTASAANGLAFGSGGTSNSVTATGNAADDAQTATFTGTTTSLTLSPTSGPSGVTVTATGSGFAATDSQVTVSNPSDASLAVCAVSAGTITGTCTFVASVANGFTFSTGGSVVVVSAKGNAASDSQTAAFTGVTASLTLAPSQGPSGVGVTAAASGFASTDTSIVVKGPASAVLCTITVSGGSGSGSCTFIATGASGFAFSNSGVPNTVTATGTAAGDRQTATFTGTTTSLALSPTSGPSGVTVTVTGSGFASTDTQVTVSNPSDASLAVCAVSAEAITGTCTFVASAANGFTFSTGGSVVVVTAKGNTAGDSETTTFSGTTPTIAVTPGQGPIGASVTVAGMGFSVSTPVSSIIFDGVAITSCTSGSLTAGPTGSFSCTFAVPTGTSGASVVATDAAGQTASGTFTVTPLAIAVTPRQGPSGASVTVAGTGFSVSTPVSSLTFDGVVVTSCVAGSLTTGPAGSFSCTFAVPSGTNGVSVTGKDAGGRSASASFTVTTPAIVVTPVQGPEGANVTVAGTGFSVSTLLESLVFDTVAITSCTSGSLMSGATGSFSCAFVAPAGTSGTSVVAIDAGGWTASGTFTVTAPSLALNLKQGLSGATVTASGSGFTVGSAIAFAISAGGTLGSTSACRASGTGNISGCTFTVSGPAGTYTITATDGSGSGASAPFHVMLLTISPTSGGVGGAVAVSGGGFVADSAITLTFGSDAIASCASGELVTGPTGTFSCIFAVPSSPAGVYTVNATDASGYTALSLFTVESLYPVTFTATGLASGTNWTVTIDGVANSSTATTITFMELNGTHDYTVEDVPGWHQTTLPYSGKLTVNGAAVAEPTLQFNSVTYAVMFTESGLPLGTTWWVNLTNGGAYPGTGTTITLAASNGSYTFSVGAAGGRYAAPGGTFEVSGGPISPPTIVFSTTRYSVTFTETGLASGTWWWVNITGGPSGSSATTTITFSLVNGSYSYVIASANPSFQAPGGAFLVRGASVAVPAIFTSIYPITFTETGLPSGSPWSVTLGGFTKSASAGTGITFSEGNGTYSYTVSSIPGWHQSTIPYAGTIRVQGQGITLPSLAFTRVTYTVTFLESGLPAGATWWANLTNGQSFRSTTSTIVFQEPNGSYAFLVQSPGFVAFPASGSFAVTGGALGESIGFVLATFTVTFTESGLPPSTNWSVALNGATRASATDSITFSEPNGTYAFTVRSSDTRFSSPGGQLSVDGTIVLVYVTFTRTTYRVSFTESGLPSGTIWSVTLNGQTARSSTGVIVFDEANGSYNFAVGQVPNYLASPVTGTVTVNGTALNEPITFTPVTFTVTFTETGLPSATNWSVSLGGQLSWSIGSSIAFQAPNGTYAWTIGVVPGYRATPVSGSLSVAGGAITRAIVFQVMTYVLTFTETGLPSQRNWSVTLNGIQKASSTSTITFLEANGTYSYLIGDVAGWHQSILPYAGSLTVNGAAVTEPTLVFDVFTLPVGFLETGLPASLTWQATANGTAQYSTGSTITFLLANGTYTYAIAATGYLADPAAGTIAVAGGPLSVAIRFSPSYSIIVYRPSGVVNGTVWNATLHGNALTAIGLHLPAPTAEIVTENTTGTTLAFVVVAGNYTWMVTVWGQAGYLAQGAVSPSPSNPHPAVVPPPLSGGGPGGFSLNPLILVSLAIVVAAALAAGLVVVGVRRRRRATEEVPLFEGYVPPPEEGPSIRPPMPEAGSAPGGAFFEPWSPPSEVPPTEHVPLVAPPGPKEAGATSPGAVKGRNGSPPLLEEWDPSEPD